MKNKLYFLFFLLFPVSLFTQNPQLNAFKYKFFRHRLVSEFMYSAENADIKGSYIPMESKRFSSKGLEAYWADGVWWQGHYLSVLASEYALYMRDSDIISAENTLHELNNALKVYKRLDLMAELCWNGDSSLNAFYIRDDVDENLADVLSVDFINSDYTRSCGKINSVSNSPSQDQAWATYIGLALTIKLVDVDSIRNLAVNIAKSMVNAMQYTDSNGREHWQVVNPVNNLLVQKERDIQWLKYAHSKVYEYFTGEKCSFGDADTKSSKRVWKFIQNNFTIDKHGHFNWYGVLTLSSIINEKGRGEKNVCDWILRKTHILAKKRSDLQQEILFPHLPLVNILLYDLQESKTKLSKSVYEDILNSAPNTGACRNAFTCTDAPWHGLSLFCPWHNNDSGEFNMLDYMLLYNLYHLIYAMK